jgi:glycogen(starch) synthase
MRVSVVICTRNRADELANCLASLEYQTAVEFEVLVVQGPCQDSTDGLIDRYAGRIRHLRCEHANLSEARNIGIAAAAAEVVAFIDDDSVAHPKWLEQIISAYTAEDIGGVGGLVFDHTGRTLQYRYSACYRSGDTILDVAPPFDRLNRPDADPFLYLQGTNCSFRKRCLVEVGGFNEQFAYYHDETDICLRIIDKGYKLVPLDSAAVYHKHSKSDIRTPARIVLDPFFPIRSQYVFALRNGRPFYSEGELQRAINRHMARVIDGGAERRAQGEFSEEQLTHYLARVHEGRSSGLEAAGREPILRAFDDCGDARFLRFPVKREPSSRMTICFLSRDYPPTGYGGIGRFTHDLAVGFAGEGHHVHVITDSAGGDATDFENGVWIHRLAHAPRLSPQLISLASHYDLAARNYREIGRIFKDMPLDIVSAPLWNCEGGGGGFRYALPDGPEPGDQFQGCEGASSIDA